MGKYFIAWWNVENQFVLELIIARLQIAGCDYDIIHCGLCK